MDYLTLILFSLRPEGFPLFPHFLELREGEGAVALALVP
jgi:hypothetical protein